MAIYKGDQLVAVDGEHVHDGSDIATGTVGLDRLPIVEITQEQYNALTEEQLSADVVYVTPSLNGETINDDYARLSNKPSIDGHTLSGAMSSSDLGIANQNAFSSVTVGAQSVDADAVSDAIAFAAGDNVTLAADPATDTVTFSATNTTYSLATSSADGLMSSSDYAKLDGIAQGAQANAIESVLVGTEALPISSKAVSLGTAAGKAFESELTDGANLPTGSAVKLFVEGKGYQDAAGVASIVEAYGFQTAAQVAASLSSAPHLKKETVAELPDADEADEYTIYLVPNGGTAPNVKDEYMLINGEFELLGTTRVDLTGYATESYVDTATTGMATQTWVTQQGYAAGNHSHAFSDLTGSASASQMPAGFVRQYAMSAADWAALPESGRVAGALYYTWED